MSINHEMRIRTLEELAKGGNQDLIIELTKRVHSLESMVPASEPALQRIQNLESAVKKLLSMQGGGSRRVKEKNDAS